MPVSGKLFMFHLYLMPNQRWTQEKVPGFLLSEKNEWQAYQTAAKSLLC